MADDDSGLVAVVVVVDGEDARKKPGPSKWVVSTRKESGTKAPPPSID
jgi:hypothetical protein